MRRASRSLLILELAATEAVGWMDPDYTTGVLLGLDDDGLCYVLDVVRGRRRFVLSSSQKEVAERDRQLAWTHDWDPPAVRIEAEPGSAGKATVDSYGRKVLAGCDFRAPNPASAIHQCASCSFPLCCRPMSRCCARRSRPRIPSGRRLVSGEWMPRRAVALSGGGIVLRSLDARELYLADSGTIEEREIKSIAPALRSVLRRATSSETDE